MSEARKAVIKNADMSEEMQQDAMYVIVYFSYCWEFCSSFTNFSDTASAAMDQFSIEKDIAASIKKEFGLRLW